MTDNYADLPCPHEENFVYLAIENAPREGSD